MDSLKSAVVVLLALYSVVHGETCIHGEEIVNTIRESTAACLYSDVKRNLTQETIKMEVDVNVGTLRVNFPVHNNYTYTVLLFVKTEDCLEFNSRQCLPQNQHSLRQFNVSRCNTTQQQIIGSVMFSNIYSGCYIAKIRNTEMENLYSNTTTVTTKRTNIRLQDIRPAMGTGDISTEEFNGTRNISAFFKDFAILLTEKIPVKITLVQNASCDWYNEKKIMATFSLGLKENGELKCTQQANLSFLQSCRVLQGLPTVACTFIDLVPANYCLKIDPDDPDRCHKSSFYRGYKGCATKHEFVVRGKPQNREPDIHPMEVSGGGWTISLAGIFLVIGIIATVVVICKPPGFKEPPDDDQTVIISASSPEVLLLYAQDNEDFMSLMVAFREVLSSVGNCKVHDCFHSECPKLASSPGEWIQSLATNSDVKVIIVSSPCAVLYQEAMAQQVSVRHSEPLPYSHLFAIALREVKFNRKMTYKNTFVVRFDNTDLKSIMPYARYQLPLHLSKLLADMETGMETSNLEENPLVQQLTELQERLKQFYVQHPDYIMHHMFCVKDSL